MESIFLVSSNVFGKCNWFNSLKPTYQKYISLETACSFPVMMLSLKSVVPTTFTGLNASGSGGLEPYILHPDLASGP